MFVQIVCSNVPKVVTTTQSLKKLLEKKETKRIPSCISGSNGAPYLKILINNYQFSEDVNRGIMTSTYSFHTALRQFDIQSTF